MAKRFNGNPYISTMPDSENDTADTTRRVANIGNACVGHETGSWKPEVELLLNGNRWRGDSNGYLTFRPCPT